MKAIFRTDTGSQLAAFNVDINNESVTHEDARRLYKETRIEDKIIVEDIIGDMISDECYIVYQPADVFGLNMFIELIPTANEFYIIMIANRFSMYETAQKISAGDINEAAALASACCEAVQPWHFNAVKPLIKFIYANK